MNRQSDTDNIANTPGITKKQMMFLFLILSAEIAFLTYATWRWGSQHLNSDCSAEMILAELLSRTGGIITKNWYYSTELRVLNTQIIMTPLFRLFSDWRLVRTIGTAVSLIVLAGSFLFMCRSIPALKELIFISPLIVWPFSSIYHYTVLFGLFYIPYLFIIFLTLGLTLAPTRKREFLRRINLLLLAFAAGLSGFRMPVVCFTPLLFATAISDIPFSKTQERNAGPVFFRSVLAFAGCLAGCLINFLILPSHYHFSTHGNTRLTSPQWGRLIKIVRNMLSVMGAMMPKGLSLSAFASVCLLLILAVFGCFYLRLLRNWRMLPLDIRILTAFFSFSHLATVSAAFLTTESWSARYLIMPLIGVLMIPVFYFKSFPVPTQFRRAICFFFITAELLSGVAQFHTFAVTRLYPDQVAVTQYLLESGMEFGFGDWDCSDVLTELSDGRIHMCKLHNFKAPYAWYWLMEQIFESMRRTNRYSWSMITPGSVFTETSVMLPAAGKEKT